MIFNCKVVTPQGKITRIKIKEENKVECLKKLKRNGMTPIDVKDMHINFRIKKNITSNIYSSRKKGLLDNNRIVNFKNVVKYEELIEFTKLFYTLKKSGFNTRDTLITITNDTENVYFKKVLRDIVKGLEKEDKIYVLMEKYKKVFPEIYINFIKNGELTNTLDVSLNHAITYLEYEKKINDKLHNTIIPNLLMFFGIIIFIFLVLIIGVPNIQKMISSTGRTVSLPGTTLIISKVLAGFVEYWYVFVIIISVMSCIIIKYINTDEGKLDLDNLKYSNIICGKTLYLLDFTRIIKIIYLNLQNNMRIQDALEISKNVTHNSQMHSIIEKAINNVYMGKSWLDPFYEKKVISSAEIELLNKGFAEKSSKIIDSSITHLDSSIEYSINNLLKRLMEISYIIIAISLILFILVIVIPYIQIYLSELLLF